MNNIDKNFKMNFYDCHYFQFHEIKNVSLRNTVPHCIVETTGREFEVEVSFILGHLKWILSKLTILSRV